MPIIKRYPNRKLYDTEAKRYVTLEQITQLIQQGQEVQVIDYESGEDLTNVTFSQIIFEQEKRGEGFLPRALLTNLIRAGGDTLDQLRRTLVREEAPAAVGEASPLQRVEDLFQDVLQTLNVPTQRDLHELQGQLDALNARIAAILADQPQLRQPERQPEPAGVESPVDQSVNAS
jgi:polyhydroxyalkanoate synthesis repressor PhaR